MSAIVNKIETILTSEYSTTNFVELMQEIFDSMKIVAPNNFHEERSNFSSHIVGRIHVGNYTAPEGKKIAIFAVQLKKENYVEGSRSTQRSYAKKLIEGGNCDAAIVAFYTEGEPKWRLSFVRLDYEMKIEQGKLKTTENITPAKRYSFLVGKDEPSHTAIDRFRQFIIDQNSNPSLDDLEEAFSVEKVTKEFFDLYCEKFYQLQEYLDANEDFVEESKRCGFTSEQYAKKLMGQIVFLYFLQKKGWLGVSVWAATITEKEYKNIYFVSGAQGRIIKEHLPKIYIEQPDGTYRLNSKALDMISDDDEEVIANHMVRRKTWGDGSKKFLRTIFDYSKTHKGHFFENYLEPLFYDTLNKNRGAMGYCPALHARIPFLSGGLFEPLDGYDWKSNCFDIPDEIFSNKQDANDRNADGILDIFDRYNFTMSEDEPMEREVAIDPEMLGKIFENLLEVKDRKSKGAFYTPREIVHYMCQESLINYLVRKTNISEDALRDFILYGDFMKDEDTVKSKREGNGGMYISDKIFKINEEGNIVVNRLKDIDDALASVRVADPAVGSGAFPLGMMNEIVRARANITAYLAIGMNANAKRLLYKNERSPYALKFNAIKNSIFAVDIEPSAVDIAQLRLWLSLVIDDEITPNAANELEGHPNPLPLPNLECNIFCGNSLVDGFNGIKLIKESELTNNLNFGTQIQLGQSEYDLILSKLLSAQDELFVCEVPSKKVALKEQIQSLKDMIVRKQLSGCLEETIIKYNEATKATSKPFILWQLDFARVFRDNGGFDIVIGNPPYVGERKHKDVFYEIQNNSSLNKYYFGRMDFFYFFFHLGLDLLKENGICSMITTNYYLTALGARILRSDFKERSDILELFNFNETKVFNTALGQHNIITTLQKGHSNRKIKAYLSEVNQAVSTNELQKMLNEHSGVSSTVLEQEDLYDGEENYMRMSGINSDASPVNAILDKIVVESTDVLGNICNPLIGLESSLDDVYVLSKSQVMDITNGDESELEYVKEFFKGSAIHRYEVEETTDKYILYLHEQIADITKLEGIWNYLQENAAAIKGRKGANLRGAYRRGNWWVLNTPRLDMDFSETKIVTHYRTKSLRFALSTTPWYASRDVYYITKQKANIDLKYILALLNSSLYYQWFYHRGKRKGDTLELYAKPLKEVPIKEISLEEQKSFVDIVDSIIEAKKLFKDTTELEKTIDYMVYKLYGLSEDEITLIENIENRYGIV